MLKYFAWAGVCLMLDQWSKWTVLQHFSYGELKTIIPGFFNITLVYNTGAAFSFLADAGGWQRYLFTGLALVFSGWFAWELYRHPRPWYRLGMAFLIGGALGNALDRLLLGKVVDFIDWYYQSWHWPTFNIADVAITLGILCILWDGWKYDEKNNYSS